MYKLQRRNLFIALISLPIYGVIFKYIAETGWLRALFMGLVMAIIMYLQSFWWTMIRVPVYLKVGDYEKIMEELEEIGIELISEKKDKKVYRLSKAKWPYKRIRMIKRPYSLFAEMPYFVKDRLGQYIDSNQY